MGMDQSRYWFALVVKSRAEFKAEKELCSLGVQLYLPSTTVLRKWSDRKKEIVVPYWNDILIPKVCTTEIKALQYASIIY